MRLSRPRFTIMSLMIVVVIASLLLTAIVAYRERRRRMVALQAALAAYQSAKITREVAEIAVIEYIEGISKQELVAVKDEIELAQSDLKRAEERLERSRRIREKGELLDHELAADENDVQQAEVRLKQASQKLTNLGNTKDRTAQALESDLTRAKAKEATSRTTYEQMRTEGDTQ